MIEIKLLYGIHKDKLVHISQVESGIKCGCICPACQATLVARKGTEKRHHFAHHNSETCNYAVETALHLVSKNIISASGYIKLPAVLIDFGYRPSYEIAPINTYKIDSVCVEKRLGNIIPDLIVMIGGSELLVEICVTNKVDDLKLSKIKSIGMSAIEIDLRGMSYDLDFDSIQKLIIDGIGNKKWIYNKRKEHLFKKLVSFCVPKKTVSRGCAHHVDNCPINIRVWKGKSYANVIDDCCGCEHHLFYSDVEGVYCCGHNIKVSQFLKQQAVQA